MVNLTVINSSLEPQRELSLPEEIFGQPYRRDLVYEAVRSFRANQRLGTASTKNRDEVSGSGKKLWKQKHTGRARMGERTSPLWYHGGIVFGPKPRDYYYAIPKKVRRSAMRTILSERVRRGSLKVLDSMAMDDPRTKQFMERYGAIVNGASSLLFVDVEPSRALLLASRNVPGVKVARVAEVNAYDLARYRTVVFTEPALLKLAKDLTP
ncbi:MAG: 50S ribosomal protein L4 [Acidobacteria bacterium]|jgi:large subunit ribosomal protein L4|nr:50S ribosomal protein L4 [Acidobacteriota bacterium]